ncbi:MAG: class I SAM-dependent methyltransferase [Desulfurococcales archaeon]|nr:class I SAM-dependent methyltransferase [Desulfurococcales archaeon]
MSLDYEKIRGLLEKLEEESRKHYIPLIDREDGAALAAIAYAAPRGLFLDLGAGVGYSTAWIAVGAAGKADKIIAVEWDPDLAPRLELHADLIREASGVRVEVVNADAIEYLEQHKQELEGVAMAFVDIEKWQYRRALQLLAPVTVTGGYIAFHNAFFPRPPKEFFDEASRYDHTIIPTPQGLLIVRV